MFSLKGVLTNWTKGFNCSGVEGEDVVGLLKAAIDRHKSDVKIDVCAILNDTTGCLMSCAWMDKKCRIGLILGSVCSLITEFFLSIIWGFIIDKYR
jgi:hexokinase